MKKQLLSTLLIFALCNSAIGQDIVYSVSGKFDNQPIFLNSILFENLTNNSQLLFEDLQEGDYYQVNLTSQTIGSATGIHAATQSSSEFVVTQNQPGFLALTHHGANGRDVRVSVMNLNGQKVYLSSSLPVSPNGNLAIQLGQPGIYLVKVESVGGVQTFKATGISTRQPIKVLRGYAGSRQSELKSPGDSNGSEFSFVTGDELRVSAYKEGYYAQTTTLIVSESQEIEFEFWLGNEEFIDTETQVVEIFNPVTGRIWMDRNLGATRAANHITDEEAYGHLYQWGRPADGHQYRTSPATNTTSSTDQPGHGRFIERGTLSFYNPLDWRDPQNPELWQPQASANDINNPCPTGYRLPTWAELDAERLSWSSNNADGAFSSPLKLPMGGYRTVPLYTGGPQFVGVGSDGYYWSSTVSNSQSFGFSFNSQDANSTASDRQEGFSVRCIKSTQMPIVIDSDVSDINGFTFSATTDSEVSADDNTPIIARGVVWSKASNPTIDENEGITIDGEGSGQFYSNLTGLDSENTYYARTYATNVEGTVYGYELSFTSGEDPYPSNMVHCGAPTIVVEVLNPSTGKIWMDRDLGASRIGGTGDLYQWGRFADGHQCRTSAATPTISHGNDPGHSDFIAVGSEPHDWRSPQNDNLWQGVNGINNPCPSGYRVPTEAELNEERLSWSSNDIYGAYASPLALAFTNYRDYSGDFGSAMMAVSLYWSSTVNINESDILTSSVLYFRRGDAGIANSGGNSSYGEGRRVFGYGVRCIKD